MAKAHLSLKESQLTGHLITYLHLQFKPAACGDLLERLGAAAYKRVLTAQASTVHLVGVSTLEGALLGVQILELQKPHIAQGRHGVSGCFGGDDKLQPAENSNTVELSCKDVCLSTPCVGLMSTKRCGSKEACEGFMVF